MKCPKCHAANPEQANYCHMCGNKLVKSNLRVVIIIAILILLAIVAGVVIYNNIQPNTNMLSPTTSQTNYEQQIRNTIQALCDAKVNNDYDGISDIYAYRVNRYHSIYDASNGEVVERYRNYDSKFEVYSKRASIRWNTLQIWQKANGYSVVYVEDYHIDRVDKSKYSDFVLEKHIELDNNFKIVSEYDVQLSKSKP